MPAEMSRARGLVWQRHRGTLRLDRSKQRLNPNPIGSGIFCRKLVMTNGRRHHSSPCSKHIDELAHELRLRAVRKGRLRHPSAKKDTIRCTQDAFHRQISPIKRPAQPSSSCRQPEQEHEPRLFDPHAHPNPDGGEGHKNSAKSSTPVQDQTHHKTAAPLSTSASRTDPRPDV
jgi:hypothetical protein